VHKYISYCMVLVPWVKLTMHDANRVIPMIVCFFFFDEVRTGRMPFYDSLGWGDLPKDLFASFPPSNMVCICLLYFLYLMAFAFPIFFWQDRPCRKPRVKRMPSFFCVYVCHEISWPCLGDWMPYSPHHAQRLNIGVVADFSWGNRCVTDSTNITVVLILIKLWTNICSVSYHINGGALILTNKDNHLCRLDWVT
jgi:hypothetical protein